LADLGDGVETGILPVRPTLGLPGYCMPLMQHIEQCLNESKSTRNGGFPPPAELLRHLRGGNEVSQWLADALQPQGLSPWKMIIRRQARGNRWKTSNRIAETRAEEDINREAELTGWRKKAALRAANDPKRKRRRERKRKQPKDPAKTIEAQAGRAKK